jgi:hypothetical protein
MPAAPSLDNRPLVYLGASLTREEARELAPGFDFADPIARDDLYRARASGRSTFLIIDGVFGHRLAVSAREVVDVVRGGGVVFGSSSMGALRAADCWPVGVRGVGLIYRLFRLGVLDTDDEVAVALAGGGVAGSTSVALVNVRYAASKARRRGSLTRAQAEALVATAKRFFYADRRWRTLIREAGLGDLKPEVIDFITSLDLKRADARKAVIALKRFVEAGGRAPVGAPLGDSFSAHPDDREAEYDVFAGTSPDDVMGPLVAWLVGTGRCIPYVGPVILSAGEPGRSASPEGHGDGGFPALVAEARALYLRTPGTSVVPALTKALVVLLAREDAFAAGVWGQLDAYGALDAEVMRFRVAQAAEILLRREGLAVRPADHSLAEREIAGNYGFATWDAFRVTPVARRLERWIGPARATLAAAKRVRAASTEGVLVER